jgi:predicted dehydrogenase
VRDSAIVLRHIRPNAVFPVVVSSTFGVATAILIEAGLCFLGLGVQPPTPSWGNMLNAAQSITILESMPWLWLPPGVMICWRCSASTSSATDSAHDSELTVATTVRFVQIGLIGLTHPHAASLRETLRQMPEVELVGVCEPDESARYQMPVDLVDVPSFGLVDDLLRATRPDAAIIAIPADLTPAVLVQVAEAGVHAYVDKPGARCAAEFAPAVEAVLRAGVQTSHGYMRRFMPVGIAIKQLVDDGILGRLVSIEARWITTSVAWCGPSSFYFNGARSGAGMLSWLGCHYLDFMRWATSAEVTQVTALTATLSGQPIDVEDMATLALRFDNGMLGSLHRGYVTDGLTDQTFALRGTLGWLTWAGSASRLEVRSLHPTWSTAPTRVFYLGGDTVPGS